MPLSDESHENSRVQKKNSRDNPGICSLDIFEDKYIILTKLVILFYFIIIGWIWDFQWTIFELLQVFCLSD